VNGITPDLRSIEPFLRWAGGKRWLIERLHQTLPRRYNRYIEPFIGGGSVFFSLAPTKATISDTNEDLVDTYIAVRDMPAVVLDILSNWPHDEHEYLRIRSAEFGLQAEKAARFIYLNKTCWNGLYRVNKEGRFNVPYGRRPRLPIMPRSTLLACSAVLANVEIRCADFAEVLQGATAGDLVYLDPPYTVMHNNNGFIRYNERLFSWEDQIRLARCAEDLLLRGCSVVVSNAAHEDITKLYPSFEKEWLPRQSRLASNVTYRRQTEELLMFRSAY
jgi:DNA adenine methylase